MIFIYTDNDEILSDNFEVNNYGTDEYSLEKERNDSWKRSSFLKYKHKIIKNLA